MWRLEKGPETSGPFLFARDQLAVTEVGAAIGVGLIGCAAVSNSSAFRSLGARPAASAAR